MKMEENDKYRGQDAIFGQLYNAVDGHDYVEQNKHDCASGCAKHDRVQLSRGFYYIFSCKFSFSTPIFYISINSEILYSV